MCCSVLQSGATGCFAPVHARVCMRAGCVCTRIYICIDVFLFVYQFVGLFRHKKTRVYLRTCTYTLICIYVYTHVYMLPTQPTHIHTHPPTHPTRPTPGASQHPPSHTHACALPHTCAPYCEPRYPPCRPAAPAPSRCGHSWQPSATGCFPSVHAHATVRVRYLCVCVRVCGWVYCQ